MRPIIVVAPLFVGAWAAHVPAPRQNGYNATAPEQSWTNTSASQHNWTRPSSSRHGFGDAAASSPLSPAAGEAEPYPSSTEGGSGPYQSLIEGGSESYQSPSPSFAPTSSLASASQTNSVPSLQACPVLDGALPSSTPSSFHFSGNVRYYYITSELVDWDYAPTGWDNWLGVPLQDSARASWIAGKTQYKKAQYIGYTDSTFTERTPQPPSAGINGPIIRAEVGDMIQILFQNRVPVHYTSMHSMGLSYSKKYEGSDYVNTTEGLSPPFVEQEAVPPGGCVMYKWLVADTDGPPAYQPSVLRSYHPFVNLASDMDAGLVGPNIIYQRGLMDNTMTSYREYIVLYEIFDESNSWVGKAPGQLAQPYPGNQSFWLPQVTNIVPQGNQQQSQQQSESAQFHTINGFVFANNPAYEMCVDDNVIFYAMAYGSASHVFHMHGNNVWYEGQWRVSKAINDGEMFALFFQPASEGVWQVICHVAMHLQMGMEALYQVHPKNACPLPALTTPTVNPIA